MSPSCGTTVFSAVSGLGVSVRVKGSSPSGSVSSYFCASLCPELQNEGVARERKVRDVSYDCFFLPGPLLLPGEWRAGLEGPWLNCDIWLLCPLVLL